MGFDAFEIKLVSFKMVQEKMRQVISIDGPVWS